MENNLKGKYKFNYITFGGVELLRMEQPFVYEQLQGFYNMLKTCPDIYDAFPFFFYITDKQNKIVSSIKAYPDKLFFNRKIFSWLFLGGYFTDERHRGKGLGTILMDGALRERQKRGIGYGGISATNVAWHIENKLGFSFVGHARRYIILKTFRPFLEANIKSKQIINIIDILTRPLNYLVFKKIFGILFSLRFKKTLNIHVIEVNTPESSPLLNLFWKPIYKTKYYFNDSLSKILWKVRASEARKDNKNIIYIFTNKHNREKLCYLIIRFNYQTQPLGGKYKYFKRMTLVDYGFFIENDKIYDEIIKIMMNIFWKSDAEVFDIVTSSKKLASKLIYRGLINIGKGQNLIIYPADIKDLDNDFIKIENWHITSFTGNAFTF